MARIRTIKPEFFTSEDIVSLTPLARVFYIALWCEADREGRLSWKPRTLKMRYLPGDNCDIDTLAQELLNMGLIVLYEHEGQMLAEIPSFKKHQVINNRESESSLPSRVGTRPSRVKAEGRKEGKGKEGKECASEDVDVEESRFDKFWKAYPKKVGKDAAKKAFDKRKPDDDTLENMIQAIELQKVSDQWQRDGGQYIPNPATWLNQGRWMDEIAGTENQGSSVFAGCI